MVLACEVYASSARNSAHYSDFTVLKLLGTGGYGKVFQVEKNSGSDKGTIYAQKVITKARILRSSKDTEHSKAERFVLEKIAHPFIVELFYAFQTEGKLYLVLEYVPGGDMYALLKKMSLFEEKMACFYTAQIVLALEYLHARKIIYRDIKAENILIDAEGYIKLTDFGLCKIGVEENGTDTLCGTPEYMAPEVLQKESYSMPADWWALGAFTYDMLFGEPPFSQEHGREELIRSICKDKLRFRTERAKISKGCRLFIKSLLKKKPSDRLGSGSSDAALVKHHQWFKKHLGCTFALLEKRQYPDPHLPYTPHLTGPSDSRHFADFIDTVAYDTPPDGKDINRFPGFTYVEPSLLAKAVEQSNNNNRISEALSITDSRLSDDLSSQSSSSCGLGASEPIAIKTRKR